MAEITIMLPDSLHDWVEQHVASGRYTDAGDYLRDLVRREEVESLTRLRAALDDARDSGTSNRSLQDICDDHLKRRDAA